MEKEELIKNPYENPFTFENLKKVGYKCCEGSRWKRSIQSYEINTLQRIAEVKQSLDNDTYKPSKTKNFEINERGKIRKIKAHNIQDRQVYKIFVNNILLPRCKNRIVDKNAASQKGKGTDYSINMFKQDLSHAYRSFKTNDFYVITYDFHDYFNSIPHDKCESKLSEMIEDPRYIVLLREYSDLFETGYGIGGEPSQVIAIVFPSHLDRLLLCHPLVLRSGRYMDDGYAICKTKEDAKIVLKDIIKCIKMSGLQINDKHTAIIPISKSSITYLKKRFTVTSTGKIIIRLVKKNITAKIRSIKKQKKEYDEGIRTLESILQSFQSWVSYAKKYNTHKDIMKVSKIFAETFNISWNDILKIINTGGIKHVKQTRNTRICDN